MGLLDSLRSFIRTEKADANEVIKELEEAIEADLDRREAQQNETSLEAVERLQQEASSGETTFDRLKDRLGEPDPPD